MAIRSPVRLLLYLMPILAGSILWFLAGRPILSALAPTSSNVADSARIDPELAKAAANMVAPPFGTPLSLMADPRTLRTTMNRGVAAYESAANEHAQIDAARLIHIAAALGYGPARDLILENLTRGRAMRSAVPAPDAIRYAMDVFSGGARRLKDPEQAFIPLARYYAQRGELGAFATHVVETIRDDPRLRKSQALDRLFEALLLVPGSCQSIARAMSMPRADDYAQCPAGLKQRLQTHVRTAGPVGRDENSRRQALWLITKLDNASDVEHVGSIRPEARVIPGVYFPLPPTGQSGNPR